MGSATSSSDARRSTTSGWTGAPTLPGPHRNSPRTGAICEAARLSPHGGVGQALPVSIDPARTRERFPALARHADGRPVVFADAPGGTQVPEAVIEAMAAYLRTSNANVHGVFATSQETDDLLVFTHALPHSPIRRLASDCK